MPLALRATLISILLGAPSAGHAATVLLSQSFWCSSGSCSFVPDMTGPGASTSLLYTFEDEPSNPGFLRLQAEAAMVVADYGGFSARSSSTEDLNDYPVGTQGTVGPNISANARATIWDVVTVSGGSGPGTLRMTWHVTGGVDVGWSVAGPVDPIDHGQLRLSFGCTAQLVGTPTPDACPDPMLSWTAPGAVDVTVNLDMPIVFGSPVQYQLVINLQSSTGTGYYNASSGLITFQAHATGEFGSTGTLVGAEALDSIGQPVAGATIQSESGFQYGVAPEPERAALLVVGSLVLAVARVRDRA
jgi:hypothetical protein